MGLSRERIVRPDLGKEETAILERCGQGGRGNLYVKNGRRRDKVRMKHEQTGGVVLLSSAIHICDLGKEGVKWHEGSQVQKWLGREAGRACIE